MLDNFRRAVDDAYAFTDPIVQRVYVPAWNDLLQTYRELAVTNEYNDLAEMGRDVARQGYDIEHLQCVEPAPLPDEDAKDPSLPKTKTDCPRNPPAKFNFTVLKLEWGCDALKIEGGEGLMASVEWNFAKKETTIWAGAGVSAEGSALGTSVGIEGKTGFAFTFGGPSGGLQDVTLTSGVSAEAEGFGHSFEANFGTGMGAESGPSITATAQIDGNPLGGTYTTH